MPNDWSILQKEGYKSKLKLLAWSVIPVFLVCYLLAFKRTRQAVKTYNQSQLMANQSAMRRDSQTVYDMKLNMINQWKKAYTLDSMAMDASVLAGINLHCDELGLHFKEYKPLGTDRQQVWTRMVRVEGDFKSLLQLVYELEQVDRICRIASVDFEVLKNSGQSEVDELHCSLYIQNIIR